MKPTEVGEPEPLTSSFKCQLCREAFGSASALGYHKCLILKSAYDIQDSGSDDEGNMSDDESEFMKTFFPKIG